MPNQIVFNVQYTTYSPEISLACGYIIAEWAMIEESFTGLLNTMLQYERDIGPTPRQFDKIWNRTNEFVAELYSDQPLEYAEYLRVSRQIKDINGKRDSVAHGIHCTCTYKGKTYPALWIPNWVTPKGPQDIPVKFEVLKSLAERASILKQEWFWMANTIQTAYFFYQSKKRGQAFEVRDKRPPPIETLYANPLRNPKPNKSSTEFPSPLRWPETVAEWRTTQPYRPPKGSIVQKSVAILLGPVDVYGPK